MTAVRCRDAAGRPRCFTRRALSTAAAHADHGHPPARHRRARRAGHPDRALQRLGRQPGPGRHRRGRVLRARHPRAVRGAVARHVGDRRPRRRPPPRLPLAEAGRALAASGRGRARDRQRRRAADRRARGGGARRRSRRHCSRRFPRRRLLARLAYAGLFVAAGIWFRRAVWWGLAFVLLWENVVAYTAEGRRASRSPGGPFACSTWRPKSTCRRGPGPQPLRSSSSRRSPSSAGWSRRGATGAPTWTDVRASAAGRTPGTARNRTS